MTDQAEQSLAMPSTLELVREAVDSFALNKSRNSVLQVDRQTMIDVGLIIASPDRPLGDGLTHLDGELGEGLISKSAFYRFASEFRDRYEAIESTHRARALRIAELAIDQATAGRQDNLATVLKTHLFRLAAEKAVTVNDLHAIEGKHLAQIISLMDGHTSAKFKHAELELKHQDAERKAAKLEADLARAHQQVEELRLKNAERERALQRAAQEAKRQVDAKVAKSDGQITREDVYALVDKVIKGEDA